MQDRTSATSAKSSCNARPDHTSGHNRLSEECLWRVRFTSKNRHRSPPLSLPVSAKSRHMQCSTTLLFNHLVGAGEQCYRNFDANSLGRFRVDYQLQFRWPLDWQVGRLCAFEYLVNERCRS